MLLLNHFPPVIAEQPSVVASAAIPPLMSAFEPKTTEAATEPDVVALAEEEWALVLAEL